MELAFKLKEVEYKQRRRALGNLVQGGMLQLELDLQRGVEARLWRTIDTTLVYINCSVVVTVWEWEGLLREKILANVKEVRGWNSRT